MDHLVNVGEKISKLRKESKITQKLLADYLEVDQSFISKVEKGERTLTLNLLKKIASLFGCDLDYFTVEKSSYEPMNIAFRADHLTADDLEVIASMHKIARNLKFMDQLVGDDHNEV